VTVRRASIIMEPSYSRYNRQTSDSGRAFLNFRSKRMCPCAESDACPSEAARSGVRSKTNMKNPYIYMAGVIWNTEFEWWMSDPSNRVRYPVTVVFSLLISNDRPSDGICLPPTYMAKCSKSQCVNLKGFESAVPRKSVFFTMVNNRQLGRNPNTALLMVRDCDPPENVKVLSSTLVKLYLAG